MANVNDDFLNIHQQIQYQSKVAFKYFLATNSLNNRNSCFLLNENLKSGNWRTKNITAKIDETRSKNNIIRDRKCNLNGNSLESIIKNLECSSKPTCERSESVTADQFQEFLMLFNEDRTKEVVTEQKQRTFAKSFAPQTLKERYTKQFNENVNVVDVSETRNIENQQNKQKVDFKTARQELNIQRKQGNNSNISVQKRKLGTRRGVGSKFVSPMLSNESNEDCSSKSQEWVDEVTDDHLKNLDAKMIELIKSEIMDTGPPIDWNDIAGLEFAKTAIQEAVVWPMLRPDIFTGLRRPPKGILLFGPPGTGKTLIGKCVAAQSKSTFFSISASSLTSKWVGDGEKMVRALFAVARCHQPAVIFIDEIDSLLSQRSDTEHESSRRIKTEFLVQLDGATTDNDEKLLVIGATNRPQELDEAARRRFVKRLYIPLPEIEARQQLVKRLMLNEKHELNEENIVEISELSDGYSGADMRNLCADASMGPIRSMDMSLMQSIQTAQVRAVNMEDFRKALRRVKSSVSPKDLEQYVVWDKTYGSGSLCY